MHRAVATPTPLQNFGALRCQNLRSGKASGGRATTRSQTTRSGDRLVASAVTGGQARQQLAKERRGWEQLLEVVEHEQQAPLVQEAGKQLRARLASGLP